MGLARATVYDGRMPDQPSPRRRFQFRLRTLLIGVTLAAVACAYVAREAQIVRERKAWLKAHSSNGT
jgi:hypothetical protein